MIADEADRALDRPGVDALPTEPSLGSRHEDGMSLVQPMEASEIDEAAVEDVDRSGLGDQRIENAYIRKPSFGDPGEGRDAAPEIEERVHLHACLRAPEASPGENGQAEIDRGRVERVDRPFPLVDFLESERLVDVEAARLDNETLGEVPVDAPVALLVRIGERAPRDGTAEAEVVELVRYRAEAGFDVAQTLSIRELSEGHRQVLVAAGELSDSPVAVVAPDAAVQYEAGAMRHQLREHRLPVVHHPFLCVRSRQDAGDRVAAQIGAASSRL